MSGTVYLGLFSTFLIFLIDLLYFLYIYIYIYIYQVGFGITGEGPFRMEVAWVELRNADEHKNLSKKHQQTPAPAPPTPAAPSSAQSSAGPATWSPGSKSIGDVLVFGGQNPSRGEAGVAGSERLETGSEGKESEGGRASGAKPDPTEGYMTESGWGRSWREKMFCVHVRTRTDRQIVFVRVCISVGVLRFVLPQTSARRAAASESDRHRLINIDYVLCVSILESFVITCSSTCSIVSACPKHEILRHFAYHMIYKSTEPGVNRTIKIIYIYIDEYN